MQQTSEDHLKIQKQKCDKNNQDADANLKNLCIIIAHEILKRNNKNHGERERD